MVRHLPQSLTRLPTPSVLSVLMKAIGRGTTALIISGYRWSAGYAAGSTSMVAAVGKGGGWGCGGRQSGWGVWLKEAGPRNLHTLGFQWESRLAGLRKPGFKDNQAKRAGLLWEAISRSRETQRNEAKLHTQANIIPASFPGSACL